MHSKTFLISGRQVSAAFKPVAVAALLLLGAESVTSQQLPSVAESAAHPATGARDLKLVMGSQHELNLPSGVERIAIGDDSVAGVHIKRTGKGAAAKILLSPIKPGNTTLMVWQRAYTGTGQRGGTVLQHGCHRPGAAGHVAHHRLARFQR